MNIGLLVIFCTLSLCSSDAFAFHNIAKKPSLPDTKTIQRDIENAKKQAALALEYPKLAQLEHFKDFALASDDAKKASELFNLTEDIKNLHTPNANFYTLNYQLKELRKLYTAQKFSNKIEAINANINLLEGINTEGEEEPEWSAQ